MSRRASTPEGPLTLITGGAGFIGTNLADRLLAQGAPVMVFDDLARAGVERNLAWLRIRHPGKLQVEIADVRDFPTVRRAVDRADRIFHLAAQGVGTSSMADPVRDFEINARGTLNVLEAARTRPRPPPILLTSTHNVYAALPDAELERRERRYSPVEPRLAAAGLDERRPLEFQSPYGCSKGAADQYVLGYARRFGMPAAVFRMSCIYGPHQCGTEDHGWVARLLMLAQEQRTLTINGDGCQVRDVLYVEDLVDALLLGMRAIDRLSGQAFNIGGGPANAVSLLELADVIGARLGLAVRTELADCPGGDQRYYVTNNGKFSAATGWSPAIPVAEGIGRLHDWLAAAAPAQATEPARSGNGRARSPGSACGPAARRAGQKAR